MSQRCLARKIRILEICRVRVRVCALSRKLEFDTNVNFWPPNIQFTSYITIAHSIRLVFLRLFLFLKVKSDHFSRFYGHFSDFSLVCRITRICQNNEMAIESSKMLGWSSNKFCWITNCTSFHVVFVFRSSIPIFSSQNSSFHVQLLDFRGRRRRQAKNH